MHWISPQHCSGEKGKWGGWAERYITNVYKILNMCISGQKKKGSRVSFPTRPARAATPDGSAAVNNTTRRPGVHLGCAQGELRPTHPFEARRPTLRQLSMTPVRTRRPRPAAATSDEDVLESLHSTVASVFGQVQHSVAVHRKHQVSLNEVHKRCCEIVGQRPDGTLRLVGEKAFLETFLASLNRVLAIKRAEAVAERCIRFAASYTAYAQEAFRPEGLAPGEDYDETPAERFSEKLLKHLMRGFGAKDKNVRFRCVELVALLVMELKAIDDDIFVLLKAMLKERIFDKEAYVRVHAVIAMGSLQGGGDPSGQDEEAEEVRSILLWLLRHDPSA